MAIGVWMYGVLGATQDSLLRERELLDAPFGETHAVASEPAPPSPPKPAETEKPRRKSRRRATPRRP